MKPTPEQIAAAKAWTKCDESSRQHALLLGSHTHDSMGRIAAEILLAALEAAEERANIANRVLAAYSKVLDVLGAPAEGSDLQDLHEWAGALKTKLEAAEQDTARLDWQVNNYRQAIKWLEDNPELHISYDAGDPEVGVFPVWEILKKIGATSDGPIWETVSVDAAFVSAIDAARKEART